LQEQLMSPGWRRLDEKGLFGRCAGALGQLERVEIAPLAFHVNSQRVVGGDGKQHQACGTGAAEVKARPNSSPRGGSKAGFTGGGDGKEQILGWAVCIARQDVPSPQSPLQKVVPVDFQVVPSGLGQLVFG
jgi:hypothetical protein